VQTEFHTEWIDNELVTLSLKAAGWLKSTTAVGMGQPASWSAGGSLLDSDEV
jgi:hypothetical protein